MDFILFLLQKKNSKKIIDVQISAEVEPASKLLL